MLGTLVNTFAVIIGASIGLLIKKGIPERIGDSLMKGLGLCSLYIGISGAFKGENTLIMIVSIVVGIIIGEGIDIDSRVNSVVKRIESKFFRKKGKNNIAQGFISASLLFCVGSMTLVGAMNAGLLGDNTMLYTKSAMDFCSSIIFASTLGIGVLLSAIFVLIYQGGLTLLAIYAAPLLNNQVINEMTCVGSLIIIAMGLNILGITKIKLMNYIPAMFYQSLYVCLCNKNVKKLL